ncbi:MAG: ATP phosphoribosyltransferase regulatory subunit [Oscillospiraceae bacterium]|nr:ATP phosphoribosyltransferase regulatory subunit [Oscillospiraceae bacterium]
MDENVLKREEKAVFGLRSLYRKYGYLPYKMSKFEEYEYYIRNKDFLTSDRIITFNDTNGKLLALKPDVTLSIIKNGGDAPGCKQKVYYNENIYRVSGSTGQYREIMQAGLECIGDIDLYDIYETVSLAAQSLQLISEDFVIQISHLGVLAAVLDRISGDQKFRQSAIAYIAEKNAHDLSRLCREYGIGAEESRILSGFVTIYGNREWVLDQLEALCGSWAEESLAQLKALSKMLDKTEFNPKILFDFSVVNNMNYYNGIVFKGFLNGICDGILAGGQYDKLMQKLQRKAGAIGFAIYLDLLEQLPGNRAEYDVDVLLLYNEETDFSCVSRQVERLIAEGKNVYAQKQIPPKLRCRQIVRLGKDGAEC